ncbi:MAG: phenylalanine--tRNA ligase subunit alpha [Acidobacteria bacterium]|nr:phenylalanine--tRNA ligase subunit alpha [Acidobacteriota bacterium]
MENKIRQIKQSFEEDLRAALPTGRLADIRIKYLSRRQGMIPSLLQEFRGLPSEQKPAIGRSLNHLKQHIEEEIRKGENHARTADRFRPQEDFDITLPGVPPALGSIHPISQIQEILEGIFLEMGYSIEEGPEVETDFYNFEALHMPKDHPARDMQDTFYLPGGLLLRTHTSPVQIRTMKKQRPPLKIIAPGKAFRRDSDISHSPMFHQLEGLVVDEGITFGDLKGTLEHLCRAVFDEGTRVRLRPSYFPFVEPGAEYDISCLVCDGKGCRSCGSTGWLEMGGAGMVHPEVFRTVGLDPEKFSGFAFGLGIDRIAMLRYGIDDIRLFFENDIRFLRQIQDCGGY